MLKISVIGAGIGGLTAGLACAARGYSVEVRERANALEDVGAGIQLPPNAMRVLGKLGVRDALEAVGVRPRTLQARAHDGARLFAVNAQGWGAPYVHVHRADYVRVLADALEAAAPGALRLGCGVEAAGDLDADVVVAADGARSGVRDRVFGAGAPTFRGSVAWRAVVPVERLANPPERVACVWMGPGAHAVTYRLRGGRLANFVGVVDTPEWAEESWSRRGDRAEALSTFGDWHPVVAGLVEGAEGLHAWGLFDREPLERWVAGRVVLLGDAAHPMLPFMAQGAAMAVEDAWVLAEALSRGDVPGGLAAYQRRRQQRTARAQAVSRRNGTMFHAEAPRRVLSVAGRIAPGVVGWGVRRRLDWLYGADVTEN